MRSVVFFLLFAISTLSGFSATIAATLAPAQENDPAGCSLRLSGDIVEGDLEALKRVVGEQGGRRGRNYTLCLSSKGGNLAEGMRIADYLLDRTITTRIEAGKECLSACAIVFMAGTERRTNLTAIARSMSATSRLGFHAPIPPSIAGRVDSDQAYDAAVEAIGRQLLRLARYRNMQWTQPLIKPELINEMMLVSSRERFYEIDTIGKAAKYQINLPDPPAAPPTSVSTVRHLCFNTLALVYDSETASRYFNIELASYGAKPAGKETEEDSGGVEGTLHTLRIRYKFGRCHVIAQSGDRDYRVAISHGANTHPVEFVPSWYALPPERLLDPTKLAALPNDAFCDQPKSATEKTVCAYAEFRRFERLAQSFIRRVRAKELRTSADNGEFSAAEEKEWRDELAACNGEYICISNSYTNRLFHTFRWGRSQ